MTSGPVAVGAEGPPPTDLRSTWLGVAAWSGALLGLLTPFPVLVPAMVGLLVGAACCWRLSRLFTACLLVAMALAGMGVVRLDATRSGVVARWALQRPVVDAELVVRSDPVVKHGRFGDYVVAEAEVRSLIVRGRTVRSRVPVLVIGGTDWKTVPFGSSVEWTGRLGPSSTAHEAAVLSGETPPRVVRPPPWTLRGAARVRAAVRRAAAGGPDQASALVPALVTGDDQGLSDALEDDFRTAGLTHLTAVSGTNLTLVLASLMLIARWCGVRARARVLVGLCGVAGFVLLARPEPSVLRAAAMGTVALLGLGTGGRAAGVRALGVAVLVLLVVDPWLAVSPGFALSTLATAGILFGAPPFRSALAGWLPPAAAEAVAVPLAAQLACTPLVAVLSGQVSIVALVANLLAAPAVGPATVLGLAAGLVGLVAPPAGHLLARPAVWAAQLIVEVATRGAALPVAAVGWPSGTFGTALLAALCLAIGVIGPVVLRRRLLGVGAALVMVVVLVCPLPRFGWPPHGWVMVMCDVGQGDALVLAAGRREAVVVDAGPDPVLVDRCLDRLGVRRVPAVVLTHFHADHVDGLPGVLEGRAVGELEVDPLRLPVSGADEVDDWAAASGVPVRVPAYGERDTVGDLTWTVLAPHRLLSDSPNDASIVLLVRSRGLRLLLTGDVEPPSQGALLHEQLGRIDVLKVPHHGSRYQDPRLLTDLGARVALVSVGVDNDYGHPDPGTMSLLRGAGALVRRTDEDGDIAVVVREGRLSVVTQH